MTRYRRRKLKALAGWCMVAALPAGAAAAVRLLPAAADAIGRIGAVRVDKNRPESASFRMERAAVKTSAGDFIISEGFGWREESAPSLPEEVVLSDPYETVSDSPGEKPYPAVWQTGAQIVRTTYGEYSGDAFFDLDACGQVNNRTDIPNEVLLEESRIPPDFTVTDISEPLVLLYHTHTTESFEPFVRENGDDSFNYRTTDETKNIVMVGDAIQAELEAAGIGVIHLRTVHDYPSYNGSYARSRESILPVLEANPSIRVALDIHRDAISSDSGLAQPFTEICGREAAQVMIISGCDDGTLGMPDYMKNFHFACALQQQLEGDWSGLTRPVLFDYRHYNQDLTTGSLLIEVGSHGNTLSQVQWSGQLIGRSLATLLSGMEEG